MITSGQIKLIEESLGGVFGPVSDIIEDASTVEVAELAFKAISDDKVFEDNKPQFTVDKILGSIEMIRDNYYNCPNPDHHLKLDGRREEVIRKVVDKAPFNTFVKLDKKFSVTTSDVRAVVNKILYEGEGRNLLNQRIANEQAKKIEEQAKEIELLRKELEQAKNQPQPVAAIPAKMAPKMPGKNMGSSALKNPPLPGAKKAPNPLPNTRPGFWIDQAGKRHDANNGAISFYDRENPYFAFTNFYETPFSLILDGYEYTCKTSEHAFQSLKFAPGSKEFMEILNAETPRDVFMLANGTTGRFKNKIRPDWQNVSEQIMYQILSCKFSQDENLRQLLDSTGNRVLIEDAGKNDAFWGNGADGKGRNKLGISLTEVRGMLRGYPDLRCDQISSDLVLPTVEMEMETDLQKAVRLIHEQKDNYNTGYGTAKSLNGIRIEFGISRSTGGVYIQEMKKDNAIYIKDGELKEGKKGWPHTYKVVTEESCGWAQWAAPIVINALDRSRSRT